MLGQCSDAVGDSGKVFPQFGFIALLHFVDQDIDIPQDDMPDIIQEFSVHG